MQKLCYVLIKNEQNQPRRLSQRDFQNAITHMYVVMCMYIQQMLPKYGEKAAAVE